MDHLAPVIRQLQEHAARLTTAVGVVRYLGDSVTSEEWAVLMNARQSLENLGGDLDTELSAVLGLTTRLQELCEEPLEVATEPGWVSACPTPDYTALDLDFGDVRVTTPPAALDQLIDAITDQRRCLRQAEKDTEAA